MNTLPLLDEHPRHHPDCCVSLSAVFVEALLERLPRFPDLVLSVGSGTGLLEAQLLHASNGELDIKTVEVSDLVNRHMPKELVLICDGTWATHPVAQLAATWMFVYPRSAQLIESYVERHTWPGLRSIIWVGPMADWPEYRATFADRGFSIDVVDGCGLTAYDTMAEIKTAG